MHSPVTMDVLAPFEETREVPEADTMFLFDPSIRPRREPLSLPWRENFQRLGVPRRHMLMSSTLGWGLREL